MSIWMRSSGIGLAFVLLLGGPAGCAGDPSDEAASRYGIYAVDDGDLVRLDGTSEWERATWSRRQSLDPKLSLLINDPEFKDTAALSALRQSILLEQVAHVRQQVSVKNGARAPAAEDMWVASQVERFRIPVDFGPVSDRPGMIRVSPREPLGPGLYSIRVGHVGDYAMARFGVGWPAVDKQQYAAQHCVDQYQGIGSIAYFDCQAEPAKSAVGLRIGDLKSTRRTVDGVPMLTVVGVVENTSDRPVRIPPLKAWLKSGQGVRQLWTFDLDRLYLLPAERAPFHSEIEWPMGNSDQIHVSFETTGES